MNTDPDTQQIQQSQQAQVMQQSQSVQQPPGVSVPVGGSEGAPASVSERNLGSVEEYVQPSESDPVIPEEVARAGIESVRDHPNLHPDSQAAGVTESNPTSITGNSNYVPPPFTSIEEAENVAKTTKPAFSLAWIAEEVAKKFKRSTPQEA